MPFNPPEDLTWPDVMIAVAITFATAALILPFAPLGIDHHHDGIMLKPALDVADGQILFRDSFSQYGPLTTFIHAWVVAVSPMLLTLKYLTVLLNATSLGLFYLVWRHLLPRCLAVLAAAVFVILNPVFDSDWILFIWSSDTAMLFQAIAWLAMLRVLSSRDPTPWAVVLGMTAVAVFWCRQPVGMSLIGTICCIFAGVGLAGWRPLSGIWRDIIRPTVFAALAGVASMVGYLTWHGALGVWWYQNIEWPRRWALTDDDYWWGRWAGESLNPARGLALGMLILAISGVAWAARRWNARASIAELIPALFAIIAAAFVLPLAPGFLALRGGGWGLVLLSAVAGLVAVRAAVLLPALQGLRPRDYIPSAALAGLSFASLTQLYPVPCQRHLYWALGPALGAAVYALWRFSGMSARSLTLLFAVAFIPAAFDTWRAGSASLGREMIALRSPGVLSGMRVTRSHAAFLSRIDAAIERMQRADPRRCFTMIGFDALFLTFVDNKTNLSPFYVTWTGLIPPTADAARIKALRTHRPFLLLQGVSPAYREAFCVEYGYMLVDELPDEYLTLISPKEAASRFSR